MPEIVSQVETLEKAASSNGSKAPRLKTWAASPKLFPCDISPDAQKLMHEVRELACMHHPHA